MSLIRQSGALISRISSTFIRAYCSESGGRALTTGEETLKKILAERFQQSTFINVEDISGGCGSMYEIQIESPEFKGIRTVMQHRMVNEALKEQIKDMHGLRISTAVPENS